MVGIDVNGTVNIGEKSNINTEGTYTSALTTSTHIAGNKGKAIINSTSGSGYNMLAKMNSENGVWTLGTWLQTFNLFYTSNSIINAESNSVTKRLVLLNEDGDSIFPGNLTIAKDLIVNGIAKKIFQHHGDAPSNFNNALTHGSYHVDGSYTNAPSSGTIYGILLVYESKGLNWIYNDTSSWIWQIFINTEGQMYMRTGVNAQTMGAWKKFGGNAMCTAACTSRKTINYSTAWTLAKVPLDVIKNTAGVASMPFEISNGGVKVKRAMKALVSARLSTFQSPKSGEFDIHIHRNNLSGDALLDGHSNIVSEATSQHIICPVLVDLNANDILYLNFSSGATGTYRTLYEGISTNITIQEVQ